MEQKGKYAKIIHLYLIIFLLILLNIFQVIRNLVLVKQIDKAIEVNKILEGLFENNEMEWEFSGKKLDNLRLVEIKSLRETSLYSEAQRSERVIVMFISQESCLNCIRDEIDELNSISNLENSKILGIVMVKGFGLDSAVFVDNIKRISSKFPIFILLDKNFFIYDIFRTCIVVVNENKEIFLTYIPVPGDKTKRYSFYKLLKHLFK